MRKTIRIGARLARTDPYWVLVCETTRQRAQELGVVLVDVNLPFDSVSGEAQLSLLEDLLAQELDALLTPRLPEALARQMVAAGLPLVFSDEMEYSIPGVTSPRGLDEAAAIAGHYLLDLLPEGGTVLMIGGEQNHLATVQRRVEAFQHVLVGRPALRCIHIPTLWRYSEAYDRIMGEAEHWRQAVGPSPAAAVFGLSDSLALAGRDAGRQLGLADGCTKVVGINGDPLAVAAIIEGSMHATIETSAADLARAMVDWGCRAARHEPLPAHFPFTLRVITRDNAAQVAAEKLVEIADLPSSLVDVNVRLEQQRLVQMETSLEINRRVGSILDGSALLRELAEIIRERYEFDSVHLYWWREADCCFAADLPESADSPEPADSPDKTAAGNCINLGESGVLGYALMRNQAVYIPDAPASARFAPDPRCPDVRSRVVLPIRVGGKTLGVLDLRSNKRSPRSQIVLDALQTLADQLGVTLRNAQLYAQALEAKAEAERASLLKSRLLANVSHELRTPLNIILGYSQAALSEPNSYGAPLPPDLVHDLHYIERSGQHLVRLIDDLLNLAQAEIGALEVYPERIDVRSLLDEVFCSMSGALTEPGVAWRLQLPEELPAMVADPVRLRQVLLNLLSNAARFTQRGHIVLGAVVEEETLHIWVEDTGVGISRAEQEHIFESFRWVAENGETLRSGRGIGLGLSVAQHLVALHGGTLSLQSRPGHGTICHVLLPLGVSESAQLPGPPPLEAGPESSERVLLGVLQHASELTQSIAAYLVEHHAGNVSREQIADALKVSPNYLSRVFRSDTGMTPWQYLSHYRIIQAQKLLLTTSMSITDVAVQVGFNDPAYFVRVFHKETGKSPLRYRKSAK